MICLLHHQIENQIAGFTDCTTRRPIAKWHPSGAQNSSSRGNHSELDFDQGKRNLVQVSGDFELSKFELTEYY